MTAPPRNELIGALMVFREQRVKHHYDSAKGAEDMDKVLAAIDKYVQAAIEKALGALSGE